MSVSVSTHVLDTSAGRPAAGVAVELFLLREGERSRVASGVTDADGRIAGLARDLEPGTYRLEFYPPSPFFTAVELQVELDDGHYHVPLLVSAFGCASYRGS